MLVKYAGTAILLAASAAAQPFTVGSVSAQPGEAASGWLKVAVGADIPITIVHGRKPGHVLALVAGIHGYEYSPILALHKLRSKIPPEAVSGTVIMVHVANMPSFLRRTIYYGPEDGQNLNRVFPGKADGTLSERIANALTKEVIERADYLIDLHCGDGNESLRPYSYWMRTGTAAVDQRARRMAVAFGLDHIVIDDERPRDPGHSQYCSNTAATRGKPAITVESGGLGSVPTGLNATDSAITNLETGVTRVLQHLKMIPGAEPQPAQGLTWIVRNAVLRSDATGIFRAEVRKDQLVREGDLLGVVSDFFGAKAFELHAPFGGKILYVIATPPINKGEPLAMIGAPGPPPEE